jgi:hypothetical protein
VPFNVYVFTSFSAITVTGNAGILNVNVFDVDCSIKIAPLPPDCLRITFLNLYPVASFGVTVTVTLVFAGTAFMRALFAVVISFVPLTSAPFVIT